MLMFAVAVFRVRSSVEMRLNAACDLIWPVSGPCLWRSFMAVDAKLNRRPMENSGGHLCKQTAAFWPNS